MTPKSYAITLLACTASLFLLTVTANVVLDPQYVFRTGIVRQDPNRNARIESLRGYKVAAEQTDALLFSSSRGAAFDPEHLRQKMAANHVSTFAVPFGLITDHLPALEFVLRDKAARKQKLKTVFLLLDLDFFGKPAWTNNNLNSILPPELDGGSSVAFWWRHLTAFQFRSWRDVWLNAKAHGFAPSDQADLTPAVLQGMPVRHAGNLISAEDISAPDERDAGRSFPPATHEEFRKPFNSIRPDLDRQLAQLNEFVSLCRDNDIRLTVAISPMTRKNLSEHAPEFLEALAIRLSKIVPLYDFSSNSLIADRPRFWIDFSHFNEEIAGIMLNRAYAKHSASRFGLYRGGM